MGFEVNKFYKDRTNGDVFECVKVISPHPHPNFVLDCYNGSSGRRYVSPNEFPFYEEIPNPKFASFKLGKHYRRITDGLIFECTDLFKDPSSRQDNYQLTSLIGGTQVLVSDTQMSDYLEVHPIYSTPNPPVSPPSGFIIGRYYKLKSSGEVCRCVNYVAGDIFPYKLQGLNNQGFIHVSMKDFSLFEELPTSYGSPTNTTGSTAVQHPSFVVGKTYVCKNTSRLFICAKERYDALGQLVYDLNGCDTIYDRTETLLGFNDYEEVKHKQPSNDYGHGYAGSNHATMSVSKPQCDHVWKDYHGFNDSFEYCAKCDIKKSDA